MKYIVALSLAAVVASQISQPSDDCTVALGFPTIGRDVVRTLNCVIPELSHSDCYDRANSLRVAFRAPPLDDTNGKTCSYYVVSSLQVSINDFINIPAVCSMLGGKIAYVGGSRRSTCSSSN